MTFENLMKPEFLDEEIDVVDWPILGSNGTVVTHLSPDTFETRRTLIDRVNTVDTKIAQLKRVRANMVGLMIG